MSRLGVRSLICELGMLLVLGISSASVAGEPILSIEELLAFNSDWSRSHEASPMGVPKEFDWASRPRLEAGNNAKGYKAVTGWGHVFWSLDTVGHPGTVQIRNFSTFVCSGSNRNWTRIQSGDIEGAEFQADFKGNVAKRPRLFSQESGTASVLFDAGKTFHFWPRRGRAYLPNEELCGFVVLLQARCGAIDAVAATASSGGYLIGLGADYWVDMSAPWDNFKTNKGVGLGRLKRVRSNWAWYGMSTVTDADLRRLYESGLLSAIH